MKIEPLQLTEEQFEQKLQKLLEQGNGILGKKQCNEIIVKVINKTNSTILDNLRENINKQHDQINFLNREWRKRRFKEMLTIEEAGIYQKRW